MGSKTLQTLLKHWDENQLNKIKDDFTVLDLPFHVENFCRELDDLLWEIESYAIHNTTCPYNNCNCGLDEVRKKIRDATK